MPEPQLVPNGTSLFRRIPRPTHGRRLVISDIHGCIRTFEALLDRIQLRREDHLYLLGDYINKGPSSHGVIDRILHLLERGYQVFPLRGNHEQMLLTAAARGTSALQAFVQEQASEGLVNGTGAVRDPYRTFIEHLPYYFELDDCYLVHAGFDFSAPQPFEAYDAMLEIRDYDVDPAAIDHKKIIHGHDHAALSYIEERVAKGGPVVPLDNGCVYFGEREDRGYLLCLDLDAWTLTRQRNVEAPGAAAPAPAVLPATSPVQGMRLHKGKILDLIDQLEAVRTLGHSLEERFAMEVDRADPRFRPSLRNLLHYLALRHHDIRTLQNHLGELGTSRLGRAESHVLASVRAVQDNLKRLAGFPVEVAEDEVAIGQGQVLLSQHADALLGAPASPRRVRIMVTLPTEAADDYDLVHGLLAAGVDSVRINCAHDGPAVWERMIAHVRRAEQAIGRRCTVCMDLAGPKLRIGAMIEGPRVLHLRPERDDLGRTIGPYRVWLAPPDVPSPDEAVPHLPVEAGWLAKADVDDKVHFEDTRGRNRTLKIVEAGDGGLWAQAYENAYILTGATLTLKRAKGKSVETPLGDLPPKEQRLVLHVGDTLVLHRGDRPGEPARYDEEGRLLEPAHVACTLGNVYTDVRVGEPVLFDDGKIEGVIRYVSDDEIQVEVTYAKPGGTKLRGFKGINLPESNLRLRGLNDKDRADLAFVVQHADVVNVSFVNEAEDVLDLLGELERLEAPEVFGIILKIETQRGFRNLPVILMAAMQRYPLGVMIARGDLAVECGWQHLAEVQEELLRLCEAAHVPIVWATQVLESVAKKGRPSRAEITDAAMSQRAECVMLNKGPYILEAIAMLDEILTTMQDFQQKKAPMLPMLPMTEPFAL